MYAAIAGLRTHMQNLNVIGNNVANVNTAGYKSARAVFRTSIYTTLSGGSNGTSTTGGVNPSQIGYGANMGTVDIDMSTGSYSVTGKPTDCMIDGDGFFLVGSKTVALNMNGSEDDIDWITSLNLTRVGDFDFMPDGYLAKNDGGDVVYGFLCIGTVTEGMLDTESDEYNPAAEGLSVGQPIYSDQLVPIRLPRVYKDDEGKIRLGYPRAGGGINENDGVNGENGEGFDAESPEGYNNLLDYGCTWDPVLSQVVDAKYELASVTNITIDQSTGVITATCGDLDGQVITIGCLAIGTVTNPNGVTQVGNRMYKAGQGSGDLRVTTAGGLGKDVGIFYVNGSLQTADGSNLRPDNEDENVTIIDALRLRTNKCEILSNGLEMSKTDLAQEIANMIVTQRGYQANTRIITVTDSMLEELVNMKR